ncbi:Translin [Pisolithus croceorrhizus]|nr:Translin [Pisolithus croceorrhizus]
MDLHWDHVNNLLEQDGELRERIREQVADLDKKARDMAGILDKIHSTPSKSINPLLDVVRPILHSCHETSAALAAIVPSNQFWRWKDMWSHSIRTRSKSLISLEHTSEILGIKEEWKDKFSIAVEDYLHGLITMVNELSRLAVNSVTLGDYEAPIEISLFAKNLLNLKNDLLRRRFDSLKYDLKKIEEVVYDVKLRKLTAPRS